MTTKPQITNQPTEDSDMTTQETPETLCVRTDNGTGVSGLCTWEAAEKAIRNAYIDPVGPCRQLSLGFPVRCMFATYQHRDWVKGFARISERKRR